MAPKTTLDDMPVVARESACQRCLYVFSTWKDGTAVPKPCSDAPGMSTKCARCVVSARPCVQIGAARDQADIEMLQDNIATAFNAKQNAHSKTFKTLMPKVKKLLQKAKDEAAESGAARARRARNEAVEEQKKEIIRKDANLAANQSLAQSVEKMNKNFKKVGMVNKALGKAIAASCGAVFDCDVEFSNSDDVGDGGDDSDDDGDGGDDGDDARTRVGGSAGPSGA